MPGGIGTFDELLEAMSMRQLHLPPLTHMCVCLVNIDGYYDGLITQLKRAREDKLLHYDIESIVHIETDPLKALEYCTAYLEKMSAESKASRVTTASRL